MLVDYCVLKLYYANVINTVKRKKRWIKYTKEWLVYAEKRKVYIHKDGYNFPWKHACQEWTSLEHGVVCKFFLIKRRKAEWEKRNEVKCKSKYWHQSTLKSRVCCLHQTDNIKHNQFNAEEKRKYCHSNLSFAN